MTESGQMVESAFSIGVCWALAVSDIIRSNTICSNFIVITYAALK